MTTSADVVGSLGTAIKEVCFASIKDAKATGVEILVCRHTGREQADLRLEESGLI